MTMDKSLRVHRGLIRSRSVLTRAERIDRLKASDRWSEGDAPLGLPKVRVYKISVKKKKKRKEEDEAAAAATATAAGTEATKATKGSKGSKGSS